MIAKSKLKEFCELFIFHERIEFENDKVLLNVLDEGKLDIKALFRNQF